MPFCESDDESNCFYNARQIAKNETTKSKPCTKMVYKVVSSSVYNSKNLNRVKYKLLFPNPPKMTVKEEFLVYDAVAFIRSGH